MSQEVSSADMNRRRALQLGASGAVAVMTLRPGAAQAATSIKNCTIPVPAPIYSGKWIAADGTLVAANTAGAFAPGGTYSATQVKSALAGGLLPGTTSAQNSAYIAYIRRLSYGNAGYTCYVSLQMP